MKKLTTLVVILLIACGFSACEKDDICSAETPTTPRLMIEFYGGNDVLKPVTNLKVKAEGQGNGVVFNQTATGDARYLTNANAIALPLDLSADKVIYEFTLNANDTTGVFVRKDTIEINYRRNTIYVSRACGYKMLFDLNTLPGQPGGIILNNTTPQIPGDWIQSIFVVKPNLESENETHVKIYF